MTTLIRRDDLNKMLGEWKSGVFEKKDHQKISGRGTVLILNNGPDILTGCPLAVTGRMFSNVTEEAAITEYLNYGVQLAGDVPDDTQAEQIIAITAEPIYSGRVGRVWLGGVIGASVEINCETHKYVDCNSGGLFSSDIGPFRLIAYAGSFAFILPVSMGGHLVGTISSETTAFSTVVLVGSDKYNCTVPLLAAGQTLASGLKVMIQPNRATGHWEIIAAECVES